MTAKLLLPSNKQLFAEAWHRVKGTKSSFFLLFMISLVWACAIVLALHLLKIDTWIQAHIHDWGMLLTPLMAAIASSILFLGATSIGIARARDQETNFKTAVAPWRKLLKVVIVLFAVMVINLVVGNLISSIGFAVALGAKQPSIIYVGVVIADLGMMLVNTLFLLAVPVVVDTQINPFKAMHLSLSHMRQHLWQCFLLIISLYILAFLSIFTLFIAYLWLLPLSFILFGQLYLRLIPPQAA